MRPWHYFCEGRQWHLRVYLIFAVRHGRVLPYGSEGIDRPPSDVYSYGGVASSIGDDGGSGLGRARLSPWYDAGMTWDMCLFVFVCVLSSGCIVCRPSELCVCRVECINKIGVP